MPSPVAVEPHVNVPRCTRCPPHAKVGRPVRAWLRPAARHRRGSRRRSHLRSGGRRSLGRAGRPWPSSPGPGKTGDREGLCSSAPEGGAAGLGSVAVGEHVVDDDRSHHWTPDAHQRSQVLVDRRAVSRGPRTPDLGSPDKPSGPVVKPGRSGGELQADVVKGRARRTRFVPWRRDDLDPRPVASQLTFMGDQTLQGSAWRRAQAQRDLRP